MAAAVGHRRPRFFANLPCAGGRAVMAGPGANLAADRPRLPGGDRAGRAAGYALRVVPGDAGRPADSPALLPGHVGADLLAVPGRDSGGGGALGLATARRPSPAG